MRQIDGTRRIRSPQAVLAALSATAIALGLSTVQHTTTASAKPVVWDLDLFKTCLDAHLGPNDDPLTIEWVIQDCCDLSGGVWNGPDAKPPNECVAPPSNSSGALPIPPDIGTETFTPSPLRPIRVPSDIGAETLTPTSPGPPPPTTTTTMAPPPG
jgi:ribosomal protein L30/L7E